MVSRPDALFGWGEMPTDARDAMANMNVINAVFEKAGLKLRGMNLRQ
ncbi:MAG: hypothetical protein WA996_24500 [Candidatus Promineifilaceae bacterium]